MDQWFYVQDDQQVGPVQGAQLSQLLASGRLNGQTLVWRDGMAEWAAAGSVAELRPAPAYRPAQVPIGYSTPPSYPAGGYAGYQTARPLGQSTAGVWSFVLGLVALACVICGIGYSFFLVVHGAGRNPDDPRTMTVGCVVLLGLLVAVVGIILGMVGMSRLHKRTFTIAGLIINGLILLGGLVLVIIAVLAKA